MGSRYEAGNRKEGRRCPPRPEPKRLRRESASSTRRRPSSAGAARSSGPSATPVDVSADIFRDGHDVLRAVVRCRGAGRAALAGGAARPGRRPPQRRALGGPLRRSTARALGSGRSRPGSTRSPAWRDEVARKLEAGQPTSSGEASEGAVLLRDAAADADGADQHDARAPPPTRLRARRLGRRRRSRPTLAELVERHAERSEVTRAGRAARGRRRPRAGALRLVVRALPALVRRLPRRRGAAPAAGRAGLRRALPAADPPDRP